MTFFKWIYLKTFPFAVSLDRYRFQQRMTGTIQHNFIHLNCLHLAEMKILYGYPESNVVASIYFTLKRGVQWPSGRASDSGARGRGFETYLCRVVSLSKTLYSLKVLVIPRKRWLRPDMTEIFLTGTLNLNTNKQIVLKTQYFALKFCFIAKIVFVFTQSGITLKHLLIFFHYRPDLTARDVQHIIALGARIPDVDDSWTINGAKFHVNFKYGFGMMDCSKMVELAQTWKNVPPQHICHINAVTIQM